MLFFFRRFIEALCLPVGLSALVILGGVAVRRRWIVLAGVAGLYLFSTPFLSGLLLHSLERVYPPEARADCPEADAVVVLSGGIVRGSNAAGLQWGDSANRFFTGLDLAKAGKAPILILSNGAPDAGGRPSGEMLYPVAIKSGLSPERVVVTPVVRTTEEESRVISRTPGVHSILLVTSAFHMPRAVLLFRSTGLRVLPFPTDQRIGPGRGYTPSAFLPGASSLRESELAMREYYGLAVYRTKFFLTSLRP